MKKLVLLLAALAVVLAACGGTSDEGVASLSTLPESSGEVQADTDTADTEEALLAFSACMRDNGVEDFEDPQVNADGSVEFGAFEGEGEPFGGVDRDVIEAAFEACSENLDGVAFGGGDGGFDLTEIEDTFVEFAACMRDQGIEIDDPDFSNLFGGGDEDSGVVEVSPFGDIDITDPDVQAALEECQDIFGGLGRFGGGDA